MAVLLVANMGGMKMIKQELIEQAVKKGNEIIDKIEAINKNLDEIQKQDYERERQLLGIALCDCSTIAEIEGYEKRLQENENIINNDKVLNELGEKRRKLLDEKSKLIKQLHDVLCNIIEEYKEIDARWIWIKYDEIKRIFREHRGMIK